MVNYQRVDFELNEHDIVALLVELAKSYENFVRQEDVHKAPRLYPDDRSPEFDESGDGHDYKPFELRSADSWYRQAVYRIQVGEEHSCYTIGEHKITVNHRNRYASHIPDESEDNNIFTSIAALLTRRQLNIVVVFKVLAFIWLGLKFIELLYRATQRNTRNHHHELERQLSNIINEMNSALEVIASGFGGVDGPAYHEIHSNLNDSSDESSPINNDGNLTRLACSYLVGRYLEVDCDDVDLRRPWPVSIAAFFLSEVGRNPVTMFMNCLMMDLVYSKRKAKRSNEVYSWRNAFSRDDSTINLYEKTEEAINWGGMHPMAHQGSFEQMCKKQLDPETHDPYLFDNHLSVVRQKESLLFMDWLYAALANRTDVDIAFRESGFAIPSKQKASKWNPSKKKRLKKLDKQIIDLEVNLSNLQGEEKISMGERLESLHDTRENLIKINVRDNFIREVVKPMLISRVRDHWGEVLNLAEHQWVNVGTMAAQTTCSSPSLVHVAAGPSAAFQ